MTNQRQRLQGIASEFEQALLSVNRVAALEILLKARSNSTPVQVIEELVRPALERIGDGWGEGNVALAQVYMSGKICEELVDQILLPGGQSRNDTPNMAITVLEDYHMLGKRIVYSVLRSSGFDLLDLGRTDVSGLVGRVKSDGIKILLISTLMLPSALKIKEVRARLSQPDTGIKIIVGGAPFRFDDQLGKEVGADVVCQTASEAVGAVQNVLEGIS